MDVKVCFPFEYCALVTFPVKCKAISSAPLESGLISLDGALILQVPWNYSSDKPEEDLKKVLDQLGLKGKFAGLMTAAKVRKVVTVKHYSLNGLGVTVVVTAGASNALIAGSMPLKEKVNSIGTINIVVFVSKTLTDGGLVNAVATVTEAKCLALKCLGFDAGGTSTDAVVVACPLEEGELRYTGSATRIGTLLSRAVKEAVTESLMKAGEAKSRSFLDRLRERGVTIDDMVNAALALYIPTKVSSKEVERRFVNEVGKLAEDVNLNALVLSALHLEDMGLSGLIYGLTVEDFKRDPVHMVADEIIGMAIAEYIAGTRGMFNYVRYDKKKPGIISFLGPFLDDVVASIIGGVMSKICSEE